MSRAVREVQVCDDCKTHHDVSDWPQIGGDFCTDCAESLFARQCRQCGDFDADTREFEGRVLCDWCIEEIDAEREEEAATDEA